MKYMLLMYADDSKAPRTPEEYQAVAPDWDALRTEMQVAGVLRSSSGLAPVANATT